MGARGIITTFVVVFGGIFLLLLSGLFGFLLVQFRQSAQRVSWNEALHIAETGIEYYKWCANNGIESSCATQKDYYNAQGQKRGRFSLEVEQHVSCGEANAFTVTSSGRTDRFPGVTRTVKATIAKTSVAKYAFLLNDNVWAGSDREIRGPYHSNGGIRMDGENQSLVTSAQQEWVCTSSFGCGTCPTDATPACRIEGSRCLCPGVFTTTANAKTDLFASPVPPFDFAGITVDLAQMKETAQNSGIYLPPSGTIDSRAQGYHLVFLPNGSFEARIITELSPTLAYSLEEGWHYDYFTITSEYPYATFTPPSSCSVVFVEDTIWVEGQVRGKITVASANTTDLGAATSAVLPGNITYTALDGSDGLALIVENNILLGPQSPDTMELRGVFVAQKGRFGRNHYPWNIKSKLEISGSIVSNGRVGTKWSSGGRVVSGYMQRENYFDPFLVYLPPPFVPSIAPDREIINWEEVE